MINKVNTAKKFDNNNKKKKFSAIFMYGQGPRWLSYYIRTGVKLVAVLVFSDLELKDHPKGSLKLMKKIHVKGSISRRTLRKFVKTVAKECSTMAVTKKTNPKGTLSWGSFVRDYNDEFPSTITLLAAVYKGKVLLKRRSLHQQGLKENSYSLRDSESELVKVESSKLKETETFKDVLRDGHKEEPSLSYISLQQRETPELTLGWPLGRISEAKNIPVVQWVMNLPKRSNIVGNCTVKKTEIKASEDELVNENRTHKDKEVELSLSSISFDANESPKSRPGWPLLLISVPETLDSLSESDTANSENFLVTSRQPTNELELLSTSNSLDCRIFKYEELKTATSLFSSENLIGEGGCSSVYKGQLQGGKSVAVKVLKPYKEAWNDFYVEVNIVSSINHKHIAPLIGICLENGLLISVYDFFHKGSLENCLHGGSGRSIMTWEVRFKVAVEVAEALNYLHNKSPRPAIHRDVKPSNILLTNELEPQLSDFGLAIWGSADSSYTVESDVVGTFGYIAPEYLMYGMISDKIDVYAFGVVLLELLSGKKPIGTNVPKGQEILVKWAKHLLKKKEYEALLDPKLKGDIDVAQMQRMVLAARLCISESAKARPNVSQILKLLRGEEDADVYTNEGYQDDDSFLEFGCKVRPDFAVLDADNESTSPSCQETDDLSHSAEKSHRFKLRDFLNQQED